jgi:hypothetical protein
MLAICGAVTLTLPSLCPRAAAYGWPLKPFHKMHAIRGAFDDPRFHLDAEGELSAFHFGVDIVARDGKPSTPSRRASSVPVAPMSVRRHNGERSATGTFDPWFTAACPSPPAPRPHPARMGHVHFAEAKDGVYRNPLRPRALTPFRDERRRPSRPSA